MSPDGLCTVQRSWSELRVRRDDVVGVLEQTYAKRDSVGAEPAILAAWLFSAVEALIELLPSPSRLETGARQVGATWPVQGTHPTFAGEGCAWMAAVRACTAGRSDATERAWRQAWLVLSDVLAAETLSPFSDDCR